MSDDETGRGFMDRPSAHPYECRRCDITIRLAAVIVPDGPDSKVNDGVRLACNCTSVTSSSIPDPGDLPEDWLVSFDEEVST